MDIATAVSKNGITIRLTQERWKHIVLMHPKLADKQKKVLLIIEKPNCILKGKAHELLAVSKALKRFYLVVVYKETVDDGFIITAYETTATEWLFKKEVIWSKDS